ncbi:hypothetical protein AC579_3956 [Pseudocercospora musae]|uniref:Uncharacterized protein n=1 Tax=Pseudocercospora musae TaxID=113226 RepID=A0A139I1U9_9PEZI|nr:hypothetical protein AC579_3956 [Pseudocercospora musae]
MLHHEAPMCLDRDEDDNDSLSSYTCYSSASSNDLSPEADEKRRIRQELDNAAFAEMAEEKRRQRKELLKVSDQWLRTAVCGPPLVPTSASSANQQHQQPSESAHACQQDGVELLEEFYYDERCIPESFWQPVRGYPGSHTEANLQLSIEHKKEERAQSDQEPVVGSSGQLGRDEGLIGCEQCLFVPICGIHGKGKGHFQSAST